MTRHPFFHVAILASLTLALFPGCAGEADREENGRETPEARSAVPVEANDDVAIVTNESNQTWHEINTLDAAEFFDDPKVVALCKAAERDDLETIDRLAAEGVDLNAGGR